MLTRCLLLFILQTVVIAGIDHNDSDESPKIISIDGDKIIVQQNDTDTIIVQQSDPDKIIVQQNDTDTIIVQQNDTDTIIVQQSDPDKIIVQQNDGDKIIVQQNDTDTIIVLQNDPDTAVNDTDDIVLSNYGKTQDLNMWDNLSDINDKMSSVLSNYGKTQDLNMWDNLNDINDKISSVLSNYGKTQDLNMWDNLNDRLISLNQWRNNVIRGRVSILDILLSSYTGRNSNERRKKRYAEQVDMKDREDNSTKSESPYSDMMIEFHSVPGFPSVSNVSVPQEPPKYIPLVIRVTEPPTNVKVKVNVNNTVNLDAPAGDISTEGPALNSRESPAYLGGERPAYQRPRRPSDQPYYDDNLDDVYSY